MTSWTLKAQSETEKRVIKGTRWLLLKNPENLIVERNEPQRLQKALELNQPLATAYYMKEDLRQLWSQKTQKRAAPYLSDWVARARVSGISMLEKFADTLQAHQDGTDRENHQLAARLKKARLRQNACVEDVDFRHRQGLKTAYINALIAEGKAVPIKGGRGAGKDEKAKLVMLGKCGSIFERACRESGGRC